MTAHVAGMPLEEALLPLMSMSLLVAARAVVSDHRRRRRESGSSTGGLS